MRKEFFQQGSIDSRKGVKGVKGSDRSEEVEDSSYVKVESELRLNHI